MQWRNIFGWAAVALTTIFACFWGFWGSIENFHEGWYFSSFWMNVGLMFIQYLLFALLLMALGSVSIFFPRIGALVYLAAAVALPLFFIRTSAATLMLALPLAITGILMWFGRPTPRKRALFTVLCVPLVVIVGFAVEPAIKVANRYDDGNYGARLVEGNGVRLCWAPEGPGWPTQSSDLKEASWENARRICANLNEDGTSLADTPQNIWRLPTLDEAVRSSVHHGTNAGGVWDSVTHAPVYREAPDKESPLWKVHSPVIYWWTSTVVNDSMVYRIVYNGGAQVLPKKMRMGDLGFRAVKEVH